MFKPNIPCWLMILLFLCSADALYGNEDRRFETWVKNLENKSVLVRKSAAKHLAALGDKRAVPFLLNALYDDNAEVRAQICMTLGLLGDEGVIERLRELSQRDSSPRVRTSARRAIENIETYTARQRDKKLKEMKDNLKSQGNE